MTCFTLRRRGGRWRETSRVGLSNCRREGRPGAVRDGGTHRGSIWCHSSQCGRQAADPDATLQKWEFRSAPLVCSRREPELRPILQTGPHRKARPPAPLHLGRGSPRASWGARSSLRRRLASSAAPGPEGERKRREQRPTTAAAAPPKPSLSAALRRERDTTPPAHFVNSFPVRLSAAAA